MRMTSPEYLRLRAAGDEGAGTRERRCDGPDVHWISWLDFAQVMCLPSSMLPTRRGHTPRNSCSIVHVAVELALPERLDDASVLHHAETIGERRREPEVLFDQHDGVALLLQQPDHLAELLDDHRREAFGDLVEQQQPRAGPQDARDREHLLLAARQARARTRRRVPSGSGTSRGSRRSASARRPSSRSPSASAAAAGSRRPTTTRRCRAPRGSSRRRVARCDATRGGSSRPRRGGWSRRDGRRGP